MSSNSKSKQVTVNTSFSTCADPLKMTRIVNEKVALFRSEASLYFAFANHSLTHSVTHLVTLFFSMISKLIKVEIPDLVHLTFKLLWSFLVSDLRPLRSLRVICKVTVFILTQLFWFTLVFQFFTFIKLRFF